MPSPAALANHGLVADIGGTHARFALVDLDEETPAIRDPESFAVADYGGVIQAAREYLKGEEPPRALVFAVAGPVEDGRIHFTNSGWAFSERELREKLGARRATLVNDFEAQARAVAVLKPASLVQIGGPKPFDSRGDGVIALVGPGTGLGIGGLARQGSASIPLVTEGGHAGFAPWDAMEIEVLKILMRRFGRVSAERVLSGPGLANLHDAMAEIEDVKVETLTPEEITARAISDPKSFAGQVFARFCAILGGVAGDVALTLGARQGVLIAGGILPNAIAALKASPFRARFEAKARFKDYMRRIPTRLIVEPNAGLIGAAAILLGDVDA